MQILTQQVLSQPEIAFLTSSQDAPNAPGLWPSPHFEKHESKTCWFSRMHLRGGKLSIFCPKLLENCLLPVFCLELWHFGFYEMAQRLVKWIKQITKVWFQSERKLNFTRCKGSLYDRNFNLEYQPLVQHCLKYK